MDTAPRLLQHGRCDRRDFLRTALAAGAVVSATGRGSRDRAGGAIGPISGGCFAAIVAPDGSLIGDPIRSGEGVLVADLDFAWIARRSRTSRASCSA